MIIIVPEVTILSFCGLDWFTYQPVSGNFALYRPTMCYSQQEESGVSRHCFLSSFVICVLSQMADTACVSVDSGLIPSPVKLETLI